MLSPVPGVHLIESCASNEIRIAATARPVCIRLNRQAILIVSGRYQDTITLKLIRFNLMHTGWVRSLT